MKPANHRNFASLSAREFVALSAILFVTLISRVLLITEPYFRDGPAHVLAISRGDLFIQPPGYYLFNWSAHFLANIGLRAAAAISFLNIAFSLAAVFAFWCICRRLLNGLTCYLLTAVYAFMNVVWFSSLIHSSYASMTFFGPAVFYSVLRPERKWFYTGCVLLALAAGFRPSDGVFLIPLFAISLLRISWRDRVLGLATATLVALFWWIPSAQHYGNWLGPFSATNQQLRGVSREVSLLRAGVTPRSLANVLRFILAVVTSLNILAPLALLQAVIGIREEWTRRTVVWVLPGSFFLMLVYMSDATYIAFMSGGLLLLAGLFCSRLASRTQVVVLSASLAISFAFMLFLKPVAPTTFARRVANSYSLEYTAWGVRNHYQKNLSELERESSAGSTATQTDRH